MKKMISVLPKLTQTYLNESKTYTKPTSAQAKLAQTKLSMGKTFLKPNSARAKLTSYRAQLTQNLPQLEQSWRAS